MKIRQDKTDMNEAREEELVSSLHALDHPAAAPPRPASSDPYWQNLLVRTNKRIDDISSPRALSISWAARVAIPGVVAVVSFVVALHYYAPVRAGHNSLNAIVQSLPAQAVDSLATAETVRGDDRNADVVDQGFLAVSNDAVDEYLIENGRETTLVQTLDAGQAEQFLQALNKRQLQAPL